jgi:hypothetical protein
MTLYPPLPPIDPVEALLVEVGIDAIISRKVERISPARLRSAAKLPLQIRTLSRKLIKGKLEPTIALSDFDWRTAVSELAAGWDVDQLVEMTRQFPQSYQVAASAMVVKSIALIKELSAGLPLARYQTFSGSKDLIPPDAHIFKFACVLEVIRDPLVVFPLMAAGALLRIQANAVRETYPSIASIIDTAVFQANMAAKAVKKSFEPPPRVDYGLRTWMGKPPVAQSALQQSQANVASMNARKQPQTPPMPKPPAGLLTAGQRAEAKGAPTP